MKHTLAKRPTETLTGAGAALAVYGFCTQVGLPQVVAAIIAVVVLVVPYLTSEIVDILRPHQHGVASDELLGADAHQNIQAALKRTE